MLSKRIFACWIVLVAPSLAFAAETHLLDTVLDYWWFVLIIPATIGFKKLLQKLDDQNERKP